MNSAVIVIVTIILSTNVHCTERSDQSLTGDLVPTTATPTVAISSTTNPNEPNVTTADNEPPQSEARTHGHQFNHSHHHHFHHHHHHHHHHGHNHTRHNFTALLEAASMHLARLSHKAHHLLNGSSSFGEAFAAFINRTSDGHQLHHGHHQQAGHHRFHVTATQLVNATDVVCNRTTLSLDSIGLPVSPTPADGDRTVQVLNCTRRSDPTERFLILGQRSDSNPDEVVANVTRSLELLQHSTSAPVNGIFLHADQSRRQHHGHHGQHGPHAINGGHAPHNLTFADAMNTIATHAHSLSVSVNKLNQVFNQSGVLGAIEHLTRPATEVDPSAANTTATATTQHAIAIEPVTPNTLRHISVIQQDTSLGGDTNATRANPAKSVLANLTNLDQH